MKQMIENIRNRPDHHKNRIVLIVVAAAIVILLIIWAIVGNGRRVVPDENFFQSFNSDIQSSQTNSGAIPTDVNSNSNSNVNQ